MISVQRVYESVKNLANKDQKGFVTFEMFNSFATLAQQDIFKEIFLETLDAKKIKSSRLDPEYGLSFVKRNKSDLSRFMEKASLSKSSGVFSYPDNLYSLVSVSTKTVPATQADVIYDEEQANRILESSLSAPTEEFPVALFGKSISVFPTSVSRINLSYYRTPNSPSYQIKYFESLSGRVEVFDSSLSVNFELPRQYEDELVYKISKMIGVNLKDQMVQSYGTIEDNKT